jgi:putative restriction endonuclease
MSIRKPWNEDDLLVAMNLYHKLTFGQFDQRQPVIVEVANKLGRTPGSEPTSKSGGGRIISEPLS